MARQATAPVQRHVCIHGHFYQPPRENPWLEAVELQDSAYPYHDWNERITDECYAQNIASRILDARGRIVEMTNNYARISFDVGPTLLAWLQAAAPEVYAAILAADRDSQRRFSGHGSALAVGFNHLIMPLANDRDRRTQAVWGIADFTRRFGREPEGMWLPETAVDVATLELLAEHGIRFTILEPHQAGAVRDRAGAWQDVRGGRIDTSVAYRAELPSGRELSLFFYDGPISRAVAFEGLLADGAALAARLTEALDRDGLAHIATDGESYGHHHRHGDMALAFALRELESRPDVCLSNYGQFLERYPPTRAVRIVENTSWSCVHGVERWRADCGCADGGHPGWTQAWRAPLRETLDWLRDQLAPRYQQHASRYLHDPWAARDAYIDVLLDRTPATCAAFLDRHAHRALTDGEQITVWKLLELQRHAFLMYTSCGWFFDDLARIETIQVLRYAARAVQLAGELFACDLEGSFLERLARAVSNDPACGDGRAIYERHVRTAMIDMEKVAAHHAISSLFPRQREEVRLHCYRLAREQQRVMDAGAARLVTGRVQVRSTVTGEAARLEYGVVHLGDHNLDGGVRPAGPDDAYGQMVDDLTDAFGCADFPEAIRRLAHHFGSRYSLRSLFRDEQLRILSAVLDESTADTLVAYRGIYRQHAPLMHYLTDLEVPLPRSLHRAAEVVWNDELRRAFEDEDLEHERVRALLDDARVWGLELDSAGLARVLAATIERVTRQAGRKPAMVELEAFKRARTLVELARSLPFEVDLTRTQNLLFEAARTTYPDLETRVTSGDALAAAWVDELRALGESLSVAVDV